MERFQILDLSARSVHVANSSETKLAPAHPKRREKSLVKIHAVSLNRDLIIFVLICNLSSVKLVFNHRKFIMLFFPPIIYL